MGFSAQYCNQTHILLFKCRNGIDTLIGIFSQAIEGHLGGGWSSQRYSRLNLFFSSFIDALTAVYIDASSIHVMRNMSRGVRVGEAKGGLAE